MDNPDARLAFPEYSTAQIEHIRKTLDEVYEFGNPVTGRKFTWRRIIEEIAAYTDIPLPKTPNGIRLLAERIRQFVKGPTKKNPSKSRIPEPELLSYIAEYLTHDEVSLITTEALMQPDVPLEPARRLADFVWDGAMPEPGIGLSGSRSLAAKGLWEAGPFVVHLQFDPTADARILIATEQCYSATTGEEKGTGRGWALLAPDGQIFVNLRTMETTSEHVSYAGMWRDRSGDGKAGESSLLLIRNPGTITLSERSLRSIDAYVAADTPIERIKSFDFTREVAAVMAEKTSIFQHVVDFSLLISKIKATTIAHEKGQHKPSAGLFAGDYKEPRYNEQMIKLIFENTGMQLIEAVDKYDLETFRNLVESGADVNYQTPESKWTALHYIASRGGAQRDYLRIIMKRPDLDYTLRDAQRRTAWRISQMLQNVSLDWYDPVVCEFLGRKTVRQAAARGMASLPDMDVPWAEARDHIRAKSWEYARSRYLGGMILPRRDNDPS